MGSPTLSLNVISIDPLQSSPSVTRGCDSQTSVTGLTLFYFDPRAHPSSTSSCFREKRPISKHSTPSYLLPPEESTVDSPLGFQATTVLELTATATFVLWASLSTHPPAHPPPHRAQDSVLGSLCHLIYTFSLGKFTHPQASTEHSKPRLQVQIFPELWPIVPASSRRVPWMSDFIYWGLLSSSFPLQRTLLYDSPTQFQSRNLSLLLNHSPTTPFPILSIIIQKCLSSFCSVP